MGQAKASHRLSESQVGELRRRIAQGGVSLSSIGRDFGLNEATVRYHRKRLLEDTEKGLAAEGASHVILLKSLQMDAINDMIVKNLELTARRAQTLDSEGDPKALAQHETKLRALNATTATMLQARQSIAIFPTKSGSPVYMNPAAADRLAKSLTPEQRRILLDEGEPIVKP